MQMQFDFCCMVSTQHDTIISFKKSEDLSFNMEEKKAFVKVLVNESGEIQSTELGKEFEVVTTKCCGCLDSGKGSNIHVKKTVAQMKVANGCGAENECGGGIGR